jgi:hypothetical protein
MTPEERAEYARRYYREHPELREYQRERMATRRRLLRQKRQAMASASFTLHALSCPYPERGCACRVLVVR